MAGAPAHPAPSSSRRTAQITGFAELWNAARKHSDVLLFATYLDGGTMCVRVTDTPHHIALELPDVSDDFLRQLYPELVWLAGDADRDVRGWLARRANNPRNPERMQCGRTNCSVCGLNSHRYTPAGVLVERAADDVRTFSTQPCVRILAEAHAATPGSCVAAHVEIVRKRPMSGFSPRPIPYALFTLGEAYYASRVFTKLSQWIDSKGWKACDPGARGCGLEVAEVRPDTVLSFLAESHALDPAPLPRSGADGLAGYKHLITPTFEGALLPKAAGSGSGSGPTRKTTCEDEFEIPFSALAWDALEVRPAPLRVLSFDIESFKLDPRTGRVLMCAFAADVANLAAGATELRGTPRRAVHCIVTRGAQTADVTLPPAQPGEEDEPQTQVHIVENEQQLLEEWTRLVVLYDADLLTGYNVDRFDVPFLRGRASALDVLAKFEVYSRVRGLRCTSKTLVRKSRQSGTKYITYHNAPGRLFIDMQQEVKERRQLSSYKLAHVCLTFFVEDVYGAATAALAASGQFSKFEAAVRAKGRPAREAALVLRTFAKRDMPWQEIVPHHDGSAEQRGELVEYCAQDARLPLRLLSELNVPTALAAKTSMCGIAPHHAPTMMQQALLGCAFQRFCCYHGIFRAKHRQFVRAEFPPGYFAAHTTGLPPKAAAGASAAAAVGEADEADGPAPKREKLDEDDEDEDDDDDDEVRAEDELRHDWIEAEEADAGDGQEGEGEGHGSGGQARKRALALALAQELAAAGSAPAAPKQKPKTQKQLEKELERALTPAAYVPAYAGRAPPRPTAWRAGVAYLDPKDTRSSENGGYVGGYVRDPVPGLFENPVVTLDFNSMYPSAMRESNTSGDTLLPANWQSNPEMARAVGSQYREGVMGAHWVTKQVHTGIFVHILEHFMGVRQEFKKLVKQHAAEGNAELKAVYSALETRAKLLANAAYGTTGAPSSEFACLDAAAETTGLGARYIKAVAHRLETHEGYLAEFGVQPVIVGGDTDSVFVLLECDRFRPGGRTTGRVDMARVFEAAEWLADDMNKSGLYQMPMFIAVDKVSERTLIEEKKKRYMVVAWASAAGPPKISSRGMELSRRDTLPAARDTLQAMSNLVLDVNRDVDRATLFELVRKHGQALLGGKLPLSAFVLSAGISKPLDEYRGPPSAHVELLKRLSAENPDAPIAQVGDRVQFVFAEAPDGSKMWQKARTPEELERDPSLRVDLIVNFTQRFCPPIERFLVPFCDEVDVRRLLDLRRYSFNGVAKSRIRGALNSKKRHIAQTDMIDHFERWEREKRARKEVAAAAAAEPEPEQV